MKHQYGFIILASSALIGHCTSLVINELPAEKLLVLDPTVIKSHRDFLDVDTKSDIVKTTAELIRLQKPIVPSSEQEVYDFIDKKGNPVQCSITRPKSPVKPPVNALDEEKLRNILTNRRKTCYYHKTSKWIYEYCHLKSARQVSRTKVDNQHEEFSIGRFYPPEHGLVFEKDRGIFKTFLGSGSFCKITNSPRMSEIRFICSNDKTSMYIVEVVEASICEYIFLVHVPEFCESLPKYGTNEKAKEFISCHHSSSTATPVDQAKPKSANNTPVDVYWNELNQMLNLIETTYKDSQVLGKYKNLLLKASDKLKALQIDQEFDEEKSVSNTLTDIFAEFFKAQDSTSDREESASVENDEKNTKPKDG